MKAAEGSTQQWVNTDPQQGTSWDKEKVLQDLTGSGKRADTSRVKDQIPGAFGSLGRAPGAEVWPLAPTALKETSFQLTHY